MKRIVLACCLWAASAALPAVDLDDPQDNLHAFLRIRASLGGEDVVTWWKGSVFAVRPEQRPERIFGFEGINVARIEAQPDGSYRMLTREYAVYRDPRSGAILSEWKNPYTGETNTVFHVQNDPVNNTFAAVTRDGTPRRLPFVRLGEDVILGLDVPLAYPNPIDPKVYPKESSGPMYVGSEHFGFFAKWADVADSGKLNVPMTLSWARQSPWLPWMRMGDTPGVLLFSAWGKKLGSIEEVTPDFLAHLREQAPEYLSAPKEYVQPNATSWTVYKRLVLDAAATSDGPADRTPKSESPTP
jgi:hypothetical protein